LVGAVVLQHRQFARVNYPFDASLLLTQLSPAIDAGLSGSDSTRTSSLLAGSFYHHARDEAEATPLPALPSPDPLVSDAARYRQGVDGYGDPVHLGGATAYNVDVISPRVFALTRRRWGIRSVLDVGCGRGWSALWYQLQGVQTKCVEGSPTAIRSTLLPASAVVAHDFTRGPWWPEATVDLAWCINFVHQVSRQYAPNYFAALSRAAILVVSFPRFGGWHAVEVHDLDYWILQFELRGFQLSERLTDQLKEAAVQEWEAKAEGPDGKRLRAVGLLLDTKVFINPRVASLPEHAHLFPEPGCFKERLKNATIIQRECNIGAGEGLETPLGGQFVAPIVENVKERAWNLLVRRNLHEGSQPTSPYGGSSNSMAAPANLTKHALQQIPAHLEQGNHTLGNAKVVVVVWPLVELGIGTAESLHIEKRGVEESPWLELSNDMFNFDPNVVWIGDTGYGYTWKTWCSKFNEQVIAAKARRIELGLPTSWPIFIVDWTDHPSKQRCWNVEQVVGEGYVFYSQRSIVKGRSWVSGKRWVRPGRITDPLENGKMYKHTPLIVRTDMIESLQSALRERGFTLRDRIETLDRPVDVTHLWPRSAAGDRGVGNMYSNLRDFVSDEIWKLSVSSTAARNITAHVGLAGFSSRQGRRSVSSAYVEAMLRTKIMVVTQRDNWEDHYRLFEALISGALVFTDRMLSLPAGLENGTSLIEFSSLSELQSLVEYYLSHTRERLQIAAEGRRIAMARHRSWHRIEEIVFGRALTTCPDDNNSNCVFAVHANETYIYQAIGSEVERKR
jgi:SAM-dependent methyltransferase